MKLEDEERESVSRDEEDPISENTPIRLALVVAFATGVIGFTWWASGVQSSLNTLLAGQTREIEQASGLRQRIETLERSSDMFTQVGSPALRLRIEPLERWKEQIQASGSPQVHELEKRMIALELEMQTHKASKKE